MAEMKNPEGQNAVTKKGSANTKDAAPSAESTSNDSGNRQANHRSNGKRNNKNHDSGSHGKRSVGAAEVTAEQIEAAEPPAPEREEKKRSGGTFLAVIAIIIAIIAGYGVYWLWQEMQKMQQSQMQITSTVEQAASEVTSVAEGVRGEINEVRSQVTSQLDSTRQSLESKQAEVSATVEKTNKVAQRAEQAQEALQTNLEGLYTRIGNTTREWMVREAEYLLQIANHRLQLESDVLTAIAALKLADERIKAIGEPGLLEVREAIATEIAALETVNLPDRDGISMAIIGVSNQIESLPLLARIQPSVDTSGGTGANNGETAMADGEGAAAPWWEALGGEIWGALKGLVTVRFNDRPVEALLPPEKTSFLYQNLKLQLEQARLALLQNDKAMFQANLSQAASWINSYYDMSSPEVQNLVAQINEIKDKQIAPNLPDLGGSLRVLRKAATKLEFNLGQLETAKEVTVS